MCLQINDASNAGHEQVPFLHSLLSFGKEIFHTSKACEQNSLKFVQFIFSNNFTSSNVIATSESIWEENTKKSMAPSTFCGLLTNFKFNSRPSFSVSLGMSSSSANGILSFKYSFDLWRTIARMLTKTFLVAVFSLTPFHCWIKSFCWIVGFCYASCNANVPVTVLIKKRFLHQSGRFRLIFLTLLDEQTATYVEHCIRSRQM